MATDPARTRRGRDAHRTGLAAENAAARDYEAMGAEILERRLRTPHGEIDIVASLGGVLIFVEVKKRRNQSDAAHSVSEMQWRRLEAAALHYIVGREQKPGPDPDMRFDVALVTPEGGVEIIENARSFDEW